MTVFERELVFLRQEGYCWWCLLPLAGHEGEHCAWHHRKLQKHGGSDGPENGTLAHHACHNLGTGSIHLNVKAAGVRGFLVSSWEDPATKPLLVAGQLITLHADGTCTYENENGGEGAWGI